MAMAGRLDGGCRAVFVIDVDAVMLSVIATVLVGAGNDFSLFLFPLHFQMMFFGSRKLIPVAKKKVLNAASKDVIKLLKFSEARRLQQSLIKCRSLDATSVVELDLQRLHQPATQ